MVRNLGALRDEAEAGGFTLLAYLIEVALVEAERIAEERLRTAADGKGSSDRQTGDEGQPT